ncbi:uncharacterized protein VP01_531g5 [Puccinia sorghi]|uniref:GAG-pre-integrase domain-containing protein n=1 Tax=Puccinia sorghi TaxID=27349 RepID=A0A0L6UK78_9BASI|nr:uncharacterized protein VP01_531g5 [Puccinia sorghi]
MYKSAEAGDNPPSWDVPGESQRGRHIPKFLQGQLCNGLPPSLPMGDILCDVCARSKRIQRNWLYPSGFTVHKLEVFTADLMGPFEVEMLNHGRFLLTICDMVLGFSKAKVFTIKDQAFSLT